MAAHADDVTRGLKALLPGLRRLARIALALDTLTVIASASFFSLVWSSDLPDRPRIRIEVLTPAFALTAIFVIHAWMRRRQEALVMPVLARSIGLDYSKDAKAFVDRFPARVLPERGLRKAEDHLVARLATHEIQAAELAVLTGKKNSKTLFKGIILSFPNSIPFPSFFLAQDRKTRSGAIVPRELSTDGLRHLRDVSSERRTYGIWTAGPLDDEPPALSVLVDALLRLETHLDQGSELYAALSSGREVHVVLAHKRDLFRVGGLFPTEKSLFNDVATAMLDLTVPLVLAHALIEAEQAVGSTG